MILLLLLAARAEAAPSVRCPAANDLLPRIVYCSDNNAALRAAQLCREDVLGAWAAAQAQLSLAFGKVKSTSSQQSQLTTSRDDLKNTTNTFAELLAITREATSRIASYPRAMLDNEQGGSPCYASVFQNLQKIVSDLDDRITQGIVAKNDAVSLRNRTATASAHVEAMESSGAVLKSAAAQGAGRAPASGRAWNGASNITGIAEDEARQKR